MQGNGGSPQPQTLKPESEPLSPIKLHYDQIEGPGAPTPHPPPPPKKKKKKKHQVNTYKRNSARARSSSLRQQNHHGFRGRTGVLVTPNARAAGVRQWARRLGLLHVSDSASTAIILGLVVFVVIAAGHPHIFPLLRIICSPRCDQHLQARHPDPCHQDGCARSGLYRIGFWAGM